MIDIQLLRKDPDGVAQRLATRGPAILDVARFRELEARRKHIQTRAEQAQAARNRLAKEIGQAKAKGDDAQALMKQGEALKVEVEQCESDLQALQTELEDFLRRIPNIPHESVPVGASSDDNREERRWGEPRNFAFPAKDHVDVGERLGLDFATGAKVAGSRFVVMKGPIARLHRAIAQFMLDVHTREHGYTEVYAP